ncbi:MAG: hypothetical protein DMD91_33105 [Candidatus Rokuibacteriota bacterium]|nr:MAG: hypothetical protein DMD91_33105 [Candidatus Rokubacteria bacterium]
MIAFTALRDTRPSLWLALYALTMLCVLSFIAFEVLDLDGSDFQPDPRRVSFKPAESEHDSDVRRASFIPVNAAVVSLIAAADERLAGDEGPAAPSTRPQPPPIWRPARALLARASLGDVPPAA